MHKVPTTTKFVPGTYVFRLRKRTELIFEHRFEEGRHACRTVG